MVLRVQIGRQSSWGDDLGIAERFQCLISAMLKNVLVLKISKFPLTAQFKVNT